MRHTHSVSAGLLPGLPAFDSTKESTAFSRGLHVRIDHTASDAQAVSTGDSDTEEDVGGSHESLAQDWSELDTMGETELRHKLKEALLLLEEKERDLSLAAEVGQHLLEAHASLRDAYDNFLSNSPAGPLRVRRARSSVSLGRIPSTPSVYTGYGGGSMNPLSSRLGGVDDKVTNSELPKHGSIYNFVASCEDLLGSAKSLQVVPAETGRKSVNVLRSSTVETVPDQLLRETEQQVEQSERLAIETSNEELQKLVSSLDSQLRELVNLRTKDAEYYERHMEKVQKELLEANERAKSREDEIRRLNTEIRDLQERLVEIPEYQAAIEDLSDQLKGAEEQVARLAAAKQLVDHQVEVLQAELQDVHRSMTALEHQHEEARNIRDVGETQTRLISELQEQLEDLRATLAAERTSHSFSLLHLERLSQLVDEEEEEGTEASTSTSSLTERADEQHRAVLFAARNRLQKARKDLEERTDELAENQLALDTLRSEHEDSQGTQQAFEEHVQRVRAEFAEENAELRNELANAQLSIQNLASARELHDRLRNDLELHIEKLEISLVETKEILEYARKDCERMEVELRQTKTGHREELSSLCRQLAESKEKVSQLSTDLGHVRELLQRETANKIHANDCAQTMQVAHHAELEIARSALLYSKDREAALILELEKAKDDTQNMQTALESELSGVRGELVELKDRLANVLFQLDTACTSRDDAHASKLQTEQQAQHDYRIIAGELSSCRERCEQADAELQRCYDSLSGLRDSLEKELQLRAQAEDKQLSDSKELAIQLKHVTADFVAREVALEESRNVIAQQLIDITNLSSQLEFQTEQLLSLKSELAGSQSELVTLRNETSSAQERLQFKYEELQARSEHHVRLLEAELQAAKEEVASAGAHNRALTEELQRKLEQVHTELETARREAANEQSHFITSMTEMRRQLQELRDSRDQTVDSFASDVSAASRKLTSASDYDVQTCSAVDAELSEGRQQQLIESPNGNSLLNERNLQIETLSCVINEKEKVSQVLPSPHTLDHFPVEPAYVVGIENDHNGGQSDVAALRLQLLELQDEISARDQLLEALRLEVARQDEVSHLERSKFKDSNGWLSHRAEELPSQDSATTELSNYRAAKNRETHTGTPSRSDIAETHQNRRSQHLSQSNAGNAQLGEGINRPFFGSSSSVSSVSSDGHTAPRRLSATTGALGFLLPRWSSRHMSLTPSSSYSISSMTTNPNILAEPQRTDQTPLKSLWASIKLAVIRRRSVDHDSANCVNT
ncbi:hypothetical protein BC832DRAFT_141767 [Gaertneriomyces semiglobifer]|nr:hypothetical protein BC832DRAFT_141767 [Gaertneriomyces semiglobifer]